MGYSIKDINRILKNKGIIAADSDIRNTIYKLNLKPIYEKDVGYYNNMFFYDENSARKVIEERIRIYNKKQLKINLEKSKYNLTTTDIVNKLNDLGLTTRTGNRISQSTLLKLCKTKFNKKIGGGKGQQRYFSEEDYEKIKRFYERVSKNVKTIQPKDDLTDLKIKHNGLVDHAKEVEQRLTDLLLLYSKQQSEIKELQQVQREKDWYKKQYENLLRDYDNILKETSKKENIFKRIFWR